MAKGRRPVPPRAAPEPPSVDRIPWEVAGPELIRIWSRTDKQHIVIYGPSGTGKTTLEAWLLVQRTLVRHTSIVVICTKRADKSVSDIGFPVVTDWDGVRKHPQCILWANPAVTGKARRATHAKVIYEVLDKLWVPDSNNLIAFDEIAYVSTLDAEVREQIEMYLREARSTKIEMILMKQRPQGVTREVIAETAYTFSFKPKDQQDAERVAEVFGDRKGLTPVLLGLERDRHEFLVKSEETGAMFISRLPSLEGTKLPSDYYSVRENRRLA